MFACTTSDDQIACNVNRKTIAIQAYQQFR